MINPAYVEAMVKQALAEDVGAGDVTASLIPAGTQASARVISRDAGVLCGAAFVDEVFAQLDPMVFIHWD